MLALPWGPPPGGWPLPGLFWPLPAFPGLFWPLPGPSGPLLASSGPLPGLFFLASSGLFLASSGFFLTSSWPSSGPGLLASSGLFLASSGPLLGLFWTASGLFLACSWPLPGLFLASSWPLPGPSGPLASSGPLLASSLAGLSWLFPSLFCASSGPPSSGLFPASSWPLLASSWPLLASSRPLPGLFRPLPGLFWPLPGLFRAFSWPLLASFCPFSGFSKILNFRRPPETSFSIHNILCFELFFAKFWIPGFLGPLLASSWFLLAFPGLFLASSGLFLASSWPLPGLFWPLLASSWPLLASSWPLFGLFLGSPKSPKFRAFQRRHFLFIKHCVSSSFSPNSGFLAFWCLFSNTLASSWPLPGLFRASSGLFLFLASSRLFLPLLGLFWPLPTLFWPLFVLFLDSPKSRIFGGRQRRHFLFITYCVSSSFSPNSGFLAFWGLFWPLPGLFRPFPGLFLASSGLFRASPGLFRLFWPLPALFWPLFGLFLDSPKSPKLRGHQRRHFLFIKHCVSSSFSPTSGFLAFWCLFSNIFYSLAFSSSWPLRASSGLFLASSGLFRASSGLFLASSGLFLASFWPVFGFSLFSQIQRAPASSGLFLASPGLFWPLLASSWPLPASSWPLLASSGLFLAFSWILQNLQKFRCSQRRHFLFIKHCVSSNFSPNSGFLASSWPLPVLFLASSYPLLASFWLFHRLSKIFKIQALPETSFSVHKTLRFEQFFPLILDSCIPGRLRSVRTCSFPSIAPGPH